MIDEEKINQVVDLIKSGVSKEDFHFFISNANQYSDVKGAYGNQLEKDGWEKYFSNHQKDNSLNKKTIELLFKYFKDYHSKSYHIIDKNLYAFDKGFPNNFNFADEFLVFEVIELYKS